MGRHRAIGKVYNLGRVRAHPSIDGEDMCQLLAQLEAAGQNETKTILRLLMAGSGFTPTVGETVGSEDAETTKTLNNLLFS